MKEPLLGIYHLRIRASTYTKWRELPYSVKCKINEVMRATLEKLLEQSDIGEDGEKEIKVEVELKHSHSVDDSVIALAKKLERCRTDLSKAVVENIELREELQARTNQLEEIKKQLEEKRIDQLQRQIATLRSELNNLSELSLALYYCLERRDCDMSSVRSVTIARLRTDTLEPPKLYSLLIKHIRTAQQ